MGVRLASGHVVGQPQQPGVREAQRRVGERGCFAAIRANGTSPWNRRSAQTRNGFDPNAGSSSWVVSSANRSACPASQSASAADGVVSQIRSTNGARWPSRTTAGIEAA